MSTLAFSSDLPDADNVVCVDFSQATRLAAGGADGAVRIFNRPSSSAQWVITNSFKAHENSVIQVNLCLCVPAVQCWSIAAIHVMPSTQLQGKVLSMQ